MRIENTSIDTPQMRTTLGASSQHDTSAKITVFTDGVEGLAIVQSMLVHECEHVGSEAAMETKGTELIAARFLGLHSQCHR